MRPGLGPVVAVAIIAAVGAGGCGSSKKSPSLESGRPFANGFAHRLVAAQWSAIEGDVTPTLSRQVRNFQEKIRHDGMRHVSPNGAFRHDCPPNPITGVGKDCFVYIISGQQLVPVIGIKKLAARFRLWVGYENGAWKAVSYDYDLFRGA